MSTETVPSAAGAPRASMQHPCYPTTTLHNVLRSAVWLLFVEKILLSVPIGRSPLGSVEPLEQLGGTAVERDPSDARWLEIRAVLKGVSSGARTVHLDTRRATREMFTKIDCTEFCIPRAPSDRSEAGGDAGGGDAPEERLLFFEYAAPAFEHLRGLYGLPSQEFRKSFREEAAMIALAANSKSAQSFVFTGDGKYMLKTASDEELDSMLRLLPYYAEHVARNPASLITRFHGVYRVTNPQTSRSTIFLVSSNVFSTERRLHERYDLKGSVVGRRSSSVKEGSEVVGATTMMKDMDLAERAGSIRLAPGRKRRLLSTLRADVDFLSSLGLMDYSLLVGIHRPSKPRSRVVALPLAFVSLFTGPMWAAARFLQGFVPRGGRRWSGRRTQVGVYPGRDPGVVYYIGVIDVLQRFNLRKVLERGMKGVVYNLHDISAVPPEEYRDRLLRFVEGHTE